MFEYWFSRGLLELLWNVTSKKQSVKKNPSPSNALSAHRDMMLKAEILIFSQVLFSLPPTKEMWLQNVPTYSTCFWDYSLTLVSSIGIVISQHLKSTVTFK